MRCRSCNSENVEGAKFCSECGTPLEARSKPLPAKQRKSANTSGQAPRAKSRRPLARLSTTAPEAERRQLTVMFCDLVGSTALSAQLDPEDYHAVVQHYHQSCEAVIQRYGGFVPQHL